VITGLVTAQQSVVLDDKLWSDDVEDHITHEAPGGEEFCFKHYLKNDASIPVTVDLVNKFKMDGGGWTTLEPGVTKTHYIMPEEITLELCSKTNWICDNQMNATLKFDTVNPRFVGTLTTSGLNSGEYALIYYADKPNRFVDWGGNNPGKLIATFTGDQTNLAINTNLGMNLPTEPDANIDEYDYCNGTGDNYNHCHGAKLWIVPTSDLTGEKLNAWNPSNYLFETDLITYFDCNINVLTSNYPVNEYGINVTSITLESGEEKPFFNCYGFDLLIAPGDYEMETKIVPAA